MAIGWDIAGYKGYSYLFFLPAKWSRFLPRRTKYLEDSFSRIPFLKHLFLPNSGTYPALAICICLKMRCPFLISNREKGHLIWLVLEHLLFFHILWISFHPNWRSYFSERWPNHQPIILGHPHFYGDSTISSNNCRCPRPMPEELRRPISKLGLGSVSLAEWTNMKKPLKDWVNH